MCGRYTLTRFPPEMAEDFGLPEVPDLPPRYNIAPRQHIVSLVNDRDTARPALQFLHWGLIPSWVKDTRTFGKPINARAETAAQKPLFRNALRYRRCLIPADGFYEWARQRTGNKPFYIQLCESPAFVFAGLWEHWEGESGEMIDSCVILTTRPNKIIEPIHNRMPVILKPNDYKLWMDPKVQTIQEVEHLLVPYPAEEMRVTPVGYRANNPAHDDPECVTPFTRE